MTDCPDESLFVAMLQGELADDERAMLDDHIDACQWCAQLVADLAALDAFGPPAEQDAVQTPTMATTTLGSLHAPSPSKKPAALLPAEDEKSMGEYELQEILGQGGMGVVYRARHTTTGLPVALKTLKKPHARLMRGMRLEIQALRRLDHPGIVKVLDDGVEKDCPWYAMELVDGQTLKDAMRTQASPQDTSVTQLTVSDTVHSGALHGGTRLMPLSGLDSAHDSGAQDRKSRRKSVEIDAEALYASVEDFSPLLRPQDPPAAQQNPHHHALDERTTGLLIAVAQLCHALAYLHGEGLVHCDLKPANVLLSAKEGHAVLVDFGLAAQKSHRVDPDALIDAGYRDGTALYMCPERIEGRHFDARADLYALGCILYEIFAGRAPFLGPDARSVLVCHVTLPPRRPSEFGATIPAHLEALIMRLLAKSPNERPGHAQAILNALAQMGITAHFPTPPPTPQPHLYAPPLWGRDGLQTTLLNHLQATQSPPGTLQTLSGPSGVGKTRLTMELIQRARMDKRLVLTGQCASDGAKRPLGVMIAVLQQIADVCRASGQEATDLAFGPRGPLLHPFAPFLSRLPGQRQYPEPAPLPPDSARLRLFEALIQTLDAFTQGEPLLLVFDDLHWADPLSLAFLEHLHQNALAKRPWMVLINARGESSSRAVLKLLDAPGAVRHELERLTDAEIASMTASMLGLERAPEALEQFVVQQASGNPFFVAEYLQMALDEGILGLDGQGQWRLGGLDETFVSGMRVLPTPRSIQSLIAGRLGGLDDAAGRLCVAAAILGRDAQVDVLQEVAGLEEGSFWSALSTLRRRQILEDSDLEQVRFIHDKLREASLGRLPPDHAQRWHQRAAWQLSLRDDIEPARLAWHWSQAGRADEARQAHLQAAQRALERYAHDDAESHQRAAIALGADPGQTLEHTLELIEEMLIPRGAPEVAQMLDEALELARALGRRRLEAKTLSLKGTADQNTGRLDDSIAHFQAAADLFAALREPQQEGTALNGVATGHRLKGQAEVALSLFPKVIELQKMGADQRAEGIALNDYGLVLMDLAHFGQAASYFEDAMTLFEEVGHRFGVGCVYNNLALMADRRGIIPRAQALYGCALDVFEEIGHLQAASITTHNIALIHARQGEPDLALPLFKRAMEGHRQVGFKFGHGNSAQAIAGLLLEEGHHHDALLHAEQAVQMLESVNAYKNSAVAALTLGRVHRALGQHDQARAALERNLENLKVHANPHMAILTHTELARMAMNAGHLQRAHDILQEAQKEPLPRSDHARAAVQGSMDLFWGIWCRHQGLFDISMEHLRQALEHFGQSNDTLSALRALCQQGLTALAAGQSAAGVYDSARELWGELSSGHQRRGQETLAMLRDAMEAHLEGAPMCRGERRSALSKGLLGAIDAMDR